MLGRAQFHQQLIALEFHALQFLQTPTQPSQLPTAHAAFLVDSILALRQHIHFSGLGQSFDFDSCADLLPGQFAQWLFQLAQAPLGRAHQVEHRRITGPHLLQVFFGGNAPVHQPDALGFAILRLDLFQKGRQRGLVAGVARHHFITQRKTFRGDDQRDDHLHAVRALVPAVAKAALVRFLKRRIALS